MSLFPKDQWAYLRGLRRDVDALKHRTRGYTTVHDGSTAYTARDTVEFSGATVADDAVNGRTVVTAGGGGVSAAVLWSQGQYDSQKITLPAYAAGAFGAAPFIWKHHQDIGTAFATYYLSGSVVTSGDIDAVEFPPGLYFINSVAYAEDLKIGGGHTGEPVYVSFNPYNTNTGITPVPLPTGPGFQLQGPINSIALPTSADTTAYHSWGMYVDANTGNFGHVEGGFQHFNASFAIEFNAVYQLFVYKLA